MPIPKGSTFILIFAAVCGLALLQPAAAQDYRQGIMVEEGGGTVKKKNAVKPRGELKNSTKPKAWPRGSSYVPNLTLPRTDPVRVTPASPGVYRPPPINSYGDRATGCIHSFPLNAGIGNNPTDRQGYIRQCAN